MAHARANKKETNLNDKYNYMMTICKSIHIKTKTFQ